MKYLKQISLTALVALSSLNCSEKREILLREPANQEYTQIEEIHRPIFRDRIEVTISIPDTTWIMNGTKGVNGLILATDTAKEITSNGTSTYGHYFFINSEGESYIRGTSISDSVVIANKARLTGELSERYNKALAKIKHSPQYSNISQE